MRALSVETSTSTTLFVCPASVLTRLPDATSHTFRVPSHEALTAVFPSGKKRQPSTASVWPLKVLFNIPLAASHRCKFPRPEDVKIIVLHGEMWQENTVPPPGAFHSRWSFTFSQLKNVDMNDSTSLPTFKRPVGARSLPPASAI
jgi:hypothetical protein